jgi:hypothetical protein
MAEEDSKETKDPTQDKVPYMPIGPLASAVVLKH